ncbi:hypothetical protein [Sphingomonas oligophenolica]|uniref:Uncharacterized protein n=1 Tax=Sphingomonas oligophenolica TaxID=301154 RepID=A0A502BT36_9SPHN|nr:hypothetical protein [Sphingomonas oligophenolica]TPG03987.1 hypothetical protein EAH84_15635 [Sphingomonas oligophenolica]
MATVVQNRITLFPVQASDAIKKTIPGLAVCIGVTGMAFVLARIEQRLFGSVWLQALVLAILIGTAIRTAWTPHHCWLPGIDFSASSSTW